jgi:hypothetical protein
VQDILDKLADDIKANVVETCAKVAEIHLKPERGELDRGYNKAVREIAGKIRELSKKKEAAHAQA